MKNEKKQFATIFNNVMGPIGFGPSTSNTCGPCRVSYLARKLLKGQPERVTIRFSAHSGYATLNCKGMRSDLAFAHGLLGRLPDSSIALDDAMRDLEKQQIKMELRVDDSIQDNGEHLLSVIEITGTDGETVKVCGISKGGGIIEITEIDDFPVSLGGERNVLVIFTEENDEEKLSALVRKIEDSYPTLYKEYTNEIMVAEKGGLALLYSACPADAETVETISGMTGVRKVCVLPALLPVIIRANPVLPYSNADELTAYCASTGKTLSQAATAYEAAMSGWGEEQIRAFVQTVIDAMRNAAKRGLEKGIEFSGIVQPSAPAIMDRYQRLRQIDDGIATVASIYSLAIMEYSNASGVVVCMPTAGASGTVAGVILAAAEKFGLSDEQLVDALLAAGAVGVSVSEDNDFCGGVYGCQAEVGCASAMAAAALCHLLGGNTKQILNAASMALQNMLGLVCDPVCGLVQVPCFARNMSGIANAIVSANMCFLGYDPMIPLQDTFETMKASGNCLPNKLKGCGGGLCETKKGIELQQVYFEQLKK